MSADNPIDNIYKIKNSLISLLKSDDNTVKDDESMDIVITLKQSLKDLIKDLDNVELKTVEMMRSDTERFQNYTLIEKKGNRKYKYGIDKKTLYEKLRDFIPSKNSYFTETLTSPAKLEKMFMPKSPEDAEKFKVALSEVADTPTIGYKITHKKTL